MKPVFATVLVFIALGLMARCQPTMPDSSLAADLASPIPISGPNTTGTATATPAPPPSARPSPTPEAATPEATPLPPLTPPAAPSGWRSYTTELGFSFACPADWRVDLPGVRDGTSGPLILRLYAPVTQYAGGNQLSFFYIGYPIEPGQSLETWSQQVFLASQNGMIPPRAILASERLPPAEPEDQTLLVTELAGPDPGWHVHHLYLAHGSAVLQLSIQMMPEQSEMTRQALREIAATIRFTPDAGERALLYGAQQGGSLAAYAAAATAMASITPEPRCDVMCQDATAAASITPGPKVTYLPAMATSEKQYYDRLMTATAQALTTTPTPTPSATPPATAKPAAQPGLVLYEGRSPYEGQSPLGTPSPTYAFQLAYDPAAWQIAGNDRGAYLTSRRLPSCTLMVQPIGEWGGPVVVDVLSLAGLDWRTSYWISLGSVAYIPQLGRAGPWFAIRAGSQAPVGAVEACRRPAEEVLSTFSIQ